jgi:hypothetical protein
MPADPSKWDRRSMVDMTGTLVVAVVLATLVFIFAPRQHP